MDKQTAKLIARIAENLPDMSRNVTQGWIDNPKGLKEFLSGLTPPKSGFKVWKTIKLGMGLRTSYEFPRAIKQAGMKISDWVNEILWKPSFGVATQEIEFDLVNVSVAELGFAKGATRREIYTCAIELGLELCPNKVGPQLRLQYRDQPMGERLLVGMEPIAGSGGYLNVFNVGHYGDGLWLDSSSGHPGYPWYADIRWLFVRPRK